MEDLKVMHDEYEEQELNKDNELKYLVIPEEYLKDKTLDADEKFILSLIKLLDNENGCFATNKYFADIMGRSEKTITRLIKKLDKKKYIKFVGKIKNKRVIRIYHD